MKIALVGCTVNPRMGGMGRALYDHAMALAGAGHEVVVYTLSPFPDGAPFTVRPIKYFLRFGKAAWGARFFPSLDTYDAVHLHLPFFGVADTISSLFSRVTQRQSHLFATYHMDAIGTGLKRIYFNWWYRHRFQKVLAACDAIAVTSRAYARESQLARAGIDSETCEEILLRVGTEKFNPSVTPTRKEPYFLFVGALDRAHYFKGVSLLLRAIADVLDARLVVVGAGELLNEYKKEAAQLGIAERVHFTGGVSDEELARWYAGARALVLPSTDKSEAFGIVLIEAMACGMPVIASDLPGVRAVVERIAPAGVLVPPSNIQELARALQQTWNTPQSNEERVALAERAAAVYSRATLAEQLITWYLSYKE